MEEILPLEPFDFLISRDLSISFAHSNEYFSSDDFHDLPPMVTQPTADNAQLLNQHLHDQEFLFHGPAKISLSAAESETGRSNSNSVGDFLSEQDSPMISDDNSSFTSSEVCEANSPASSLPKSPEPKSPESSFSVCRDRKEAQLGKSSATTTHTNSTTTARRKRPRVMVRTDLLPRPDEHFGADYGDLPKHERNKRSAAKYRKRRKMYLQNMESKLGELEHTIARQSDTILSLKEQNNTLAQQVMFLNNLLAVKGVHAPLADAKKAVTGVAMFVLFSAFLLTMPWDDHLLPSFSQTTLSSYAPYDPSVTGRKGRVLLSVEDAVINGCEPDCHIKTQSEPHWQLAMQNETISIDEVVSLDHNTSLSVQHAILVS